MKHYIVVGAGILGAASAYYLAKAGVKVTIVDRKDEGQATAAAAGIVCPWLSQRRNKRWYTLAKGGAAFYPKLIQDLEADGESETGYKQVGAISLHTDNKKLDQLEERAYKRRENAPEIGQITRLDAAQTKALFPPLSAEYYSVHVSGAARVDGRALRDALLRAAQKYGAEIVRGDAKLTVSGERVTGIETEGRQLSADQVLVTTGAWGRELLEPLGLRFLVTAQKAQIIHLEMPEMNTNDWPVIIPPTNHYILAFDHGQVVVGATHENDAGFDSRPTAGGVSDIVNKALAVAPGLADGTFREVRVGFRPFTPDFLPVIGPCPHYEGLLLANGLGASGLTSGPFLGAELARLALGMQTELQMSDYSLEDAIERV